MALVASRCKSEELPEKNTFIDYPPTPMADVRETPVKTAPAALFLRLAKKFSNPETMSREKNIEESEIACSSSKKLGSQQPPLEEFDALECIDDSDCGSSTNYPTEVPTTPPPTEEAIFFHILPSIGSADHADGSCNPCAWYWKPQGCQNGTSCTRCHLCPKGELKVRRKMKERHLRAHTKVGTEIKNGTICDLESISLSANVADGAEKFGDIAQSVLQERAPVSKPADKDKDSVSLASLWEDQSPEQSESPPKICVKNTFIQVSKFAPEPPTNSAPAALITQRFRLKLKAIEGEAVASDVSQPIAPTQNTFDDDASTATSRQKQIEENDKSSIEHPEGASAEEAETYNSYEAHALGRCIPCAYLWHKRDGCRLGDACKFCHRCDKGEIKKRKRERIQQMKEVGEYVPRFFQTHAR